MNDSGSGIKVVLTALLFGVAILAGQYVSQTVINHGSFSPDWVLVGGGAFIGLMAEMLRR